MNLNVLTVIVNACMAFVACCVFIWSLSHSSDSLRPWRAVGAVLAAIYAVAYIWLAFNIERSADWSKYLRPVSLIAWPCVWIAPVISGVRLWAAIQTSVKGILEEEIAPVLEKREES